MIDTLVLAAGAAICLASLGLRRAARTPPRHLRMPLWLGFAVTALGAWPLVPLPAEWRLALEDSTLVFLGAAALLMATSVESALALSRLGRRGGGS